MKNLKLLLLVSLLIIATVVCLNACNGNKNPEDETGTLAETAVEVSTEDPDANNLFHFGMVPAASNGVYGYIGTDGAWKITPQFSSAEAFSYEGYAIVSIDGKYGVINTAGQYVVNPVHDYIREYSANGLTLVGNYVDVYSNDGHAPVETQPSYYPPEGDAPMETEPYYPPYEPTDTYAETAASDPYAEYFDELSGEYVRYTANTSIYVGAGQRVAIVIRPAYSGEWNFTSNASSDTYGYLYRVNADETLTQLATNDDGGSDNNFLISYDLSAGETYVLVCRWYSSDRNGEMPISLIDPSSAETEGVEYPTYVETEVAVEVATEAATNPYAEYFDNLDGGYIEDSSELSLYVGAGQRVGTVIYAPYNGEWSFTSNADYDTCGYLYQVNDDDTLTLINSDDDSGSGFNFRISNYLSAGETYVLVCRWYDSSRTGEMSVSATMSIAEEVPYSMDNLSAYSSSRVMKYGYINADGSYAVNLQFDYVAEEADENTGYTLVRVDGKYGYVNAEGQYVINPQFSREFSFNKAGIALVCLGEKFGFIDKDGKYLVAPQYDAAGELADNGLAPVAIEVDTDYASLLYGYVDTEGNLKIDAKFLRAWAFTEDGIALVRVREFDGYYDDYNEYPIYKNVYRYIDSYGNYISNTYFNTASDFIKGYAIVGITNDSNETHYGVINKSGYFALDAEFDRIRFFYDEDGEATNYIQATKNGIHTIYEIKDSTLSKVADKIPYTVTSVESFAEHGLITVRVSDEAGYKYGAVNASGILVIPAVYEFMGDFSDDGMALVCFQNAYGMINTKGEYVINPQFAYMSEFFDDGYAVVFVGTHSPKLGVIDNTGKFVINPQFGY